MTYGRRWAEIDGTADAALGPNTNLGIHSPLNQFLNQQELGLVCGAGTIYCMEDTATPGCPAVGRSNTTAVTALDSKAALGFPIPAYPMT